MKKNKIVLFCFKLFIAILLGYIIGFVNENYGVLKNNKIVSQSIKYSDLELTDFKIKKNKLVASGSNPTITYNFDNYSYVYYLDFNYKIKDNVDWKIEYNYLNYYGAGVIDEITGSMNRNINIFSEKIDKKVKQIKITFDTKDKIEINNYTINNKIIFISLRYILYINVMITIFLLFNFRSSIKNHIEYLFLIIAFFSGATMILNQPTAIKKSWDDQIHFGNAYGLINKYYTEASYSLSDNDLMFLINDYIHFNTDKEKKEFINYLNKVDKNKTKINTYIKKDYTKIAYLPQTMVFAFKNIVPISFSSAFIMAMFMNLLAYIILVFFAIKKIPFAKYLMLVVGLIPTTIFMACGFSYDPIVISMMLLGISYYLYEFHNKKKKLNKKNLAIIILSFTVSSCVKAIYAPILLLLLTLPKEKFGNDKVHKKFICLIIILLVLLLSTFILPVLSNTIEADSRGGETNVGDQLSLVIHSPISFLRIFYNFAFLQFIPRFIDVSTIFNFAYLGVLKNLNSYYLFLFLLFLSVIVENKIIFTKKQKIFTLLIILFIISAIWGSMYLTFTPVGKTVINGVQNRYFIPLLFITLFLLITSKIKVNISKEKLYIIYSTILLISNFLPIYYLII